MIGKRAKILAQAHVEDLLFFAQHTRHTIRNQVIVLLSLKAGLRAAEIGNLAWDRVVDPTGEIATTLELRDHVAKNGSVRDASGVLNPANHFREADLVLFLVIQAHSSRRDDAKRGFAR